MQNEMQGSARIGHSQPTPTNAPDMKPDTDTLYHFDLYQLAERLNIKVIEDYIPQRGSGLYIVTKNGYEAIILNSTKKKTNKRWTLAHELGHALCYQATRNYALNTERMANKVAAETVMPAPIVFIAVARLGVDPRKIAKYFGVGKICARKRLKELGLMNRVIA